MNKKGILIITFTVLVNLVFCQEENISKKSLSLSGDIGITTNGFSPIPTFSLGRPALQAHFLATKGRFAFRPMFAISDSGR